MHNTQARWNSLLFGDDTDFREKAALVFSHQLRHLSVYKTFCDQLHRSGLSQLDPDHYCRPATSQPAEQPADPPAEQPADPPAEQPADPPDPDTIPLMPVQVFRDTQVLADYISRPEAVFQSSGTTGSAQSIHPVADLSLYLRSCHEGFARFYNQHEWSILAWLPGYTENPHSSLLAMIGSFIEQDPSGLSRFLPLDHIPQKDDFQAVANQGRRVMLFGSAFGLLDLLDALAPADPPPDTPKTRKDLQHSPHPSTHRSHFAQPGYQSPVWSPHPSTPILPLPPGSVVVETGGMKTRRRERTRQELHRELAAGFGLPECSIHSEYGMAETSSQAWDNGSGRFRTPPWMRVTIRDAANPLRVLPHAQEGLIGIIDLANVHSLAFLLTQDRGVAWPDGSFQVLGRKHHAPLRGCNFLMEPNSRSPSR